MKTLFELCTPRDDVRSGRVADADYAADLAQVIGSIAVDETKRADLFFANTHPTERLKALLHNVAAWRPSFGSIRSTAAAKRTP